MLAMLPTIERVLDAHHGFSVVNDHKCFADDKEAMRSILDHKYRSAIRKGEKGLTFLIREPQQSVANRVSRNVITL